MAVGAAIPSWAAAVAKRPEFWLGSQPSWWVPNSTVRNATLSLTGMLMIALPCSNE